jgi:hypothetical protein
MACPLAALRGRAAAQLTGLFGPALAALRAGLRAARALLRIPQAG